jgi:transaldolase
MNGIWHRRSGARVLFVTRSGRSDSGPFNARIGTTGRGFVSDISKLKIKIFADGAEIESIVALAGNPLIKGFTTNPTLMRKAGIADYEGFARALLAAVPDRPVSFEVFSDSLPEMAAQARAIASWGANVNVKIPVTNTEGVSTCPIVAELSREGIAVNVTAVMTPDQVRAVAEALSPETPAIVSVFAGRVADTGRDPVPLMTECLAALAGRPKAELLWASPRELLNIFQADEIGCHIITVTTDLFGKLGLVGRDLDAYSLDTVQMFRRDAVAAGYTIATGAPAKTRRAAVA